ncbi:MAG: alpha/beta hydrolase [Natronomonas sp.]
MQTFTHDGRSTAYRHTQRGSGPTICYIHGAGGGHRVWARQYGNSETPPAVAPDLSGHGDSDDVSTAVGPETLEAYADDVVAVCEATDATVLCGNSMGGAVALRIVLERDFDLEGLVLADSGAKLAVDPDFLETLTEDFETALELLHAPGMLFSDPTEDLVERSMETMRTTGQTVTIRDFGTCDTFDVRDRLDELDVPTLALCGEDDPLTPPEFHKYLAEEIPECTYREIADSAHMPMLERPEAFDSAVRGFLSEAL